MEKTRFSLKKKFASSGGFEPWSSSTSGTW